MNYTMIGIRMVVERLWNRFHELIVYCLIGCIGTFGDFVIYAALTRGCGVHYQFANFFSVSFGIVNNFILNYHFNFQVKNHVWRRLVSFYCVGMIGWTLSAGWLWLFVERIGITPLVAKLGTIFLVTVVQFCLNKFVTFRKESAK